MFEKKHLEPLSWLLWGHILFPGIDWHEDRHLFFAEGLSGALNGVFYCVFGVCNCIFLY